MDCHGYDQTCVTCGIKFWICKSCWRGQKYCSGDCRKSASVKSHRKAQERYSRSNEAKLDRRDYQREYRKKACLHSNQSKQLMCQKNSVTDHSSNHRNYQLAPVVKHESNIELKNKCHFCGCLRGLTNAKGRNSRIILQ